MITTHERSDLVHIMKINRLKLVDSDTAHLQFSGQFKDENYRITILIVEDLPTVIIKKNEAVLFSETVKSVDDLKIFLEEKMYKYLED